MKTDPNKCGHSKTESLDDDHPLVKGANGAFRPVAYCTCCEVVLFVFRTPDQGIQTLNPSEG